MLDPLNYMYKVIKNETKGYDFDAADPGEDREPRTWAAEPLLEEPVIDRTSASFQKYNHHPSISYISESKQAKELAEKVAKMEF